MIYGAMKDLIKNNYYKTRQEVVDRLSTFLAFNIITIEQYQELMNLKG